MTQVMVALGCGLIVLVIALGIGAWLEQGGKSKDEDYDDE
jgi:hypothetical protein